MLQFMVIPILYIYSFNQGRYTMADAKKSTKYSEFVKLSHQVRMAQSQYFTKVKSNLVPVILFSKNSALVELPNCKFMIDRSKSLHMEMLALKNLIMKKSKINETESIHFYHNQKMLGGNIKVGDFVDKEMPKIKDGDGWLYVHYDTQAVY